MRNQTPVKRVYRCTGQRLDGSKCSIKFTSKEKFEICMNSHIVAAEEVAANSSYSNENQEDMTYNLRTEATNYHGDALSN